MTLDILNGMGITASSLSVFQMSFVRAAQVKKNNRQKKYLRDLFQLRKRMVKNGAYFSGIYLAKKSEIEREYSADVAQIRDDLAFKLEYFAVSEESDPKYSYPANPNYTLAAADRYYVVYNYYMTMSDPSVRFALFQADELAREYLGSFYATLYTKLKSYI